MFKNLVRYGTTGLVMCMLSACGLLSAPIATSTATQEPTLTSAPPTSTTAPTATPTNTPVPSSTPDVRATSTAIAAATNEAISEEIRKELTSQGLPTNGSLAYYEPNSEKITVTEFGVTQFSPLVDEKDYENFILKTEFYWSSKSGLAGCGVVLRAKATTHNSPQYRFYSMRLSGAPAWDIEYWDKGKFQTNMTGKVKFTDVINIEQGTTNNYYFHFAGDNITVYANGSKLGSIQHNKLERGKLAWFAFQESGETTCELDSYWLWKLP